jgi:PAS domain S-box-containing protein/putative nucleotidyltransferase with HDIG domain
MAAMTARLHWSPVRTLRTWPRLGGPASISATLVLALALFAGIFVLRVGDPNVADGAELLFVLPIALLASRFSLRGGLVGGLLAIVLTVIWDIGDSGYMNAMLTAEDYAIRIVAFLLLGTLLGIFVDERRRSQAEVSRYYDASLDLLATADLNGRFTRVNRAWERTLGYSPETMCSQPFIEFIHPDDHEATIAQIADLADGSRDTNVGFRNRYRAADGSYRWLEWDVSASSSEGVLHAVARDVSAQHEAEQQLANNAEWLETKVTERTSELEAARTETLQLLAVAAEYRDEDTSQHTERVGVIAAEIAVQLGLDAEQVKLLREAAPLHDVGKLAIPDRILLKPGKLTPQEYEVMKTHATLGARLLSGRSSPVLQMGAVIAATHHEWWDGTGYPAGLAGEAIPLVGRIVAVADVFDALTHDRPYKSAWPVERAIAEIQRAAGSQLDPRVVAAFLSMHKDAVGAGETDGPHQRARTTGAPRQRRGSSSTARPVPRPALAGGRRSKG